MRKRLPIGLLGAFITILALVATASADNGDPIYPFTPGNCNGDQWINAADLTAISLEIFDGDGNQPWAAFAGTFQGTTGCDANIDGKIDAADMTCAVLIVFGGGCVEIPDLVPVFLAAFDGVVAIGIGGVAACEDPTMGDVCYKYGVQPEHYEVVCQEGAIGTLADGPAITAEILAGTEACLLGLPIDVIIGVDLDDPEGWQANCVYVEWRTETTFGWVVYYLN
jgi:hypothetical protein